MRVRVRVRVHVRVVAVRGWWVLHLERVRHVVAEWQRGARAAAGTTVHCGTNGTFKPARKSTQISSIRKPTEGTEALQGHFVQFGCSRLVSLSSQFVTKMHL